MKKFLMITIGIGIIFCVIYAWLIFSFINMLGTL